ncbi:MAG: HEPN domain-containing protein [Chitinophagaceae bacterium]|nr:HEPN domain-containing protein [Chitinophagaceae bacterium]
MADHNSGTLIQYRIKRAVNSLAAARSLLNNGHYDAAVNRLYYACFYAVNAVLLTKDIKVKSHAGVKQVFGEFFIKPGIIHKNEGRFYSILFNYRQDSDYLDFAEVSKEFTEELTNEADTFVQVLINYLLQNNFYQPTE